MRRRLLALLLLAALCAASLAGCGTKPAPSGGEERALLDFRLGEGVFQESPGEVRYPLDGLLALPEGENNPVVFLLHGAHGAEDVAESRYYQGFGYLAEALAEAGYLAVSININRAFSFQPFEGDEYNRALAIFEGYRDLLRRANEGEKVFDWDLTGKVDMSRVSFIGHSRGGDDSLAIAAALEQAGDASVQSVLLVSSPLMVPYERCAVDVPTGIVLSQYDGDVTGLETATVFNRAWFHDGRSTPVAMAYLYGANHNQYNSAIPQADTLAPPQNVSYLDGESQRAFLCRYAVDFLNAFHQPQAEAAALLGESAPARYGMDFTASVFWPGEVVQLPESAMAGVAQEGMAVSTAMFSQVPERNTLAPFNPPGPLGEDIALYRLKWTAAGQSAHLAATRENWQEGETLSLLLANDSTDMGHREDRPLALRVTLTDKAGNSAAVELDSTKTAALRYHPTELENLFAGMEGLPEYWMAVRHTPLAVTDIPLSAFQGVDLSAVATLTLTGVSESGACVWGGFRLSTKATA